MQALVTEDVMKVRITIPSAERLKLSLRSGAADGGVWEWGQ